MEEASPSLTPEHASSDWTKVLRKTAHTELFLACDRYANTSLGPISTWGTALRTYTTMLFADTRRACLWWGPHRVAIYNEAYPDLMGKLHPGVLGSSFSSCFSPEVTQRTEDIFQQAIQSEEAIHLRDIAYFLDRHGFTEETYFVGSFIPVRGDDGKIEGFYNTVHESTAEVLRERRRDVIDKIAATPLHPVEMTLSLIVESLYGNSRDIPMAMLYSFDDLASPGGINLLLRGSIGIPQGHHIAPITAELGTNTTGIIPYLKQAHNTGNHVLLSEADGSLAGLGDYLHGVSWCGFGEPSKHIVIMPLTVGGSILGFYIQGTNPRRPFNHMNLMSIIDITRQIEAKWAASISIEQAKSREKILERKASDSENRLRHMAQSAPMGMCQISTKGRLEWANEQFYDIMSLDRAKVSVEDILEQLAPDERPSAARNLSRMLSGGDGEVREHRLNRVWPPPAEEGAAEDEVSYVWILASSFPLVEDGKVKLVMAYVMDISRQKWAESVQSRNAAAALQAKRRQEEFIDTTSHEMRNPLTAITQLADGIRLSVQETSSCECSNSLHHVLRENADAANTILVCAAHQKRVIDDVLTLSRLDSNIFSITPIPERPSTAVDSLMKMFEGELAMEKIEIEALQDRSTHNLLKEYMLIDTSRLIQVLINLLSNAIKFTAPQQERKISLVYGAQRQHPPKITTIFGELNWIPPIEQQHERNVSLPPLKDDDERLYLYFSVQDTGKGMTPDETAKLFKRFSQATPKTHITYGGSGLGLYICRQLAEKQGGRVGVVSKSGKGSAFAFYVESMAAKASELSTEQRQAGPISQRETVEDRPSLPQRTTTNANGPVTDGEETHSKYDEQPATSYPEHSATATPTRASDTEKDDEPARYNILLVEDNLVNQKVLAKQLRTAKCTVQVANHGQEALDMLERTPCWVKPETSNTDTVIDARIDIILMDWEMPVMNGLQCCRRIRELEKEGKIDRRVPIIAITANVRQEQQEQAVKAGMDSVMCKPFTVGELLGRVEEVLGEGKCDETR